jgi:3-isopropylmalate/(R)-2-methylmalate dehydratase large subunit
MSATRPRTLFDKIWDSHVVERLPDGTCILYIDRHLVHEVTSPQAFEGLRMAGRKLRRPDCTIAVADHNIPTVGSRVPGDIKETDSRIQVQTLEKNVAEFGVPYIPILDVRQGIVHIIGPELGLSLPGMTIVCGDSHTSTHGALGALAFGIGTSEVEHVMATQTLLQSPAKNMRVDVTGKLGFGCSGKDIVLAIIGRITTAGGTGHVIEYTGEAIRALDMAGRMTVSNMSIEAGARAGLIAPDDTTFDWIKGREFAPKGAAWAQAVAYWRTLPPDPGATYEKSVTLSADDIVPMVTWGTTPGAVVPVTGVVPDPSQVDDEGARTQMQRMLEYMALTPGQKLADVPIDVVFIGSCTNGRIEDIRAAAAVTGRLADVRQLG